MANFCKQCGRPLENGRCPVCDFKPLKVDPVAAAGGYFSSLAGDVRGLFTSGNILRMAPFIGFAVVALTYLLRAFFSLGDGINSYGLYLTLSWLETIALVGVGLGALDAYRQKYAATASLFLLLGLTGVLNLLSMLAQQYTTRNYFTPCLFLLALNLFWVAADRKLRLMGLCGAGLFALVLLLQAFTTLPFLPQLAVCYGCLLMCFTLVKQQPQL